MEPEKKKNYLANMIFKAIPLVYLGIVGVSDLIDGKIYAGLALIVFSLLFAYEIYVNLILKRPVRNLEQLPFVVVGGYWLSSITSSRDISGKFGIPGQQFVFRESVSQLYTDGSAALWTELSYRALREKLVVTIMQPDSC
jgi:hypothetical protein